MGAEVVGVDAEHAIAHGERRDVAVPAAATTPANSVPRTRCLGRTSPLNARTKNGRGSRKPQSVRLTVVAWTRTSTSPAAGSGTGTSSTRSTSGGP